MRIYNICKILLLNFINDNDSFLPKLISNNSFVSHYYNIIEKERTIDLNYKIENK
jgi:hypothetical protein